MTAPNQLATFLWFKAGDLDEAIPFYESIFDDFTVTHLNPMFPGGPLFTAGFSICGHQLIGMSVEGGPTFNDAISLSLSVDGQEEVDRLWEALTSDGGAPGLCGWLKDKFGVSWQVTPIQMSAYLGNPDSAKREYAMAALRKMTKIVIDDFSPKEQA